ncbi:MAG TPA: hypothetical protein VHD36_22960 [Pirellulales bacterium]|nr:hypothetical protein [Pirellulales bacterium]
MTPLEISGLLFLCIFAAAMFGMAVARFLPDHHLHADSRDAIKGGLALIASLTALVLALVVAAAKETYDTNTTTVRQLASNGLLLDRLLELYGDATAEQRVALKHAAEVGLERIWPHDRHEKPKLTPGEAATDFEHLYFGIANLQPENDAQRALKSRALDLTTGLAQTRFRLFSQKESVIPRPFLVILVFWLMVLLGGAGLLAPRNGTTVAVLLICAFSVSCALFLILELGRPFDGLMRISSTPLREAVTQFGK